jgi:hypothetical protein
MRPRALLLALVLLWMPPQHAAADAGSDARAILNQLNPINLALGPLIDHAISSSNDALAQRLEQLRGIIQETLFNVNKIVNDATINANSDAAGRLAELNRYVQNNLATFNGVVNGSIDALDQSTKARIDQLGDRAGNLVLALPIPAQPLPNVPGEGYSLVKVKPSAAPTPLFVSGAGLMLGGKRPRAYLLTGNSRADKHFFSHDGKELLITAASMGLIEIQVPESLFPKKGQVERTLVLALNSGAIFAKMVEPSFPLLLCSGLPRYSARVTTEAYGQSWDSRTVPHPWANAQGELYIASDTDHGTDTKRRVCATIVDEGAGGWNANPNAGHHGLQYTLGADGRPGTEHIGSFSDEGNGCIDMYAARDSSGGGWAKMTGLAIHQRKLKKGQCGNAVTPVTAVLDYGRPSALQIRPQELLDKCAQVSEGAADAPYVRYHVAVIDEQNKVIDETDLVVGGLKSPLVNNTVSAEVDTYGLVKLTVASRCLRTFGVQ